MISSSLFFGFILPDSGRTSQSFLFAPIVSARVKTISLPCGGSVDKGNRFALN
jgi:hypothetical protein